MTKNSSHLNRNKTLRKLISLFFKEKRGVIGLIGIFVFVLMGFVAPILSDLAILHPIKGVDSFVGPNYVPPSWNAIFDPLIPPSSNVIPDSSFDTNDKWSFNTTDPLTLNHNYDSEVLVTGSRSVRFNFTDLDTTKTNEGKACGKIRIDWPYKTPTNASVFWNVRSNVTGNLTVRSFTPYVKFNPPPEIEMYEYLINYELRPKPQTEWALYNRRIHEYTLYTLFQPNSFFDFEFGVEIHEDDPSLTGTIEVWFDKVEIQVSRPVFGLLGTNHFGQDIFAQIIWGARVSLYVAFFGGVIAAIIGSIIGVIAGFRGGLIDSILNGFSELFLIYPTLLLLLLLVIQYNIPTVHWPVIIAAFSWPISARVVRSKVLVEREQLYIEAVRSVGGSEWYIMFKHIFPNVLGVIFVQITISAVGAILYEAGITFLQYPLYKTDLHNEVTSDKVEWFSWGVILAQSYFEGGLIIGAWWTVIPPGLCLALLTTSFMFFGNTLDKILNPPKFRKI